MRFQQLTGPAMAKGVEDTAFYNFHRLVALNEVGGSPGEFGLSVEEFHRLAAESQRLWPHGHARHLDARHQAQRGRAGADQPALRDPRALGRGGAPLVRAQRQAPPRLPGRRLPGPQRRVPPLPDPRRRLADLRRARRRLHGEGHPRGQGPHLVDADEPRVRGGPARASSTRCWTIRNSWPTSKPSWRRWSSRGGSTRSPRRCSSSPLPGVPDFYQGTEIWDLSLVDPDNRRPVDYELRRRLLGDLKAGDDSRADPGPHGRGAARSSG